MMASKKKKKKLGTKQPLTQEPEQENAQQGIMREYFITIVTCTLIALFVTTYVVHPMSVPTPSMEPTILVGDRLLVDKFTIRNGYQSKLPITPAYSVKRQDIVVCKSPLQPEIFLVKRVVGLPGETFEIRDKTVHINGLPLNEPYKTHSDTTIYEKNEENPFQGNGQRDNYGPVKIPAGSFIVMGDNRDNSLDSRFWGFLPARNVVGRPVIIFWSYQDPPDAHLLTSWGEIIQLYGQRILFFLTRTRWSRMGRLVR